MARTMEKPAPRARLNMPKARDGALMDDRSAVTKSKESANQPDAFVGHLRQVRVVLDFDGNQDAYGNRGNHMPRSGKFKATDSGLLRLRKHTDGGQAFGNVECWSFTRICLSDGRPRRSG